MRQEKLGQRRSNPMTVTCRLHMTLCTFSTCCASISEPLQFDAYARLEVRVIRDAVTIVGCNGAPYERH